MDITITASKNFCFQVSYSILSSAEKHEYLKAACANNFSISIYYYLYVVYTLKSIHYTIIVN